MARTITFGSQIAADEVEPFFAVKLDFSGDFTRTFLVTVGTTGDGNKYFINTDQQQELTIARGNTIIFDTSDSSVSSHPLRLSTTSDGTHGGGSEYTTGVTTSSSQTQIVVAGGAPDTLYYYCSAHSGMGGKINIVDAPARVWTGFGDITIDSETYKGLGDFGQITNVVQNEKLTAEGLTLSLSGIPVDYISNALRDNYQGRSVSIYFGVLVDGQLTLTPYELFTGRMDQMTINTSGDGSRIDLTVENQLIDMQRTRISRYTEDDQKDKYGSTETSLRYVSGLQEKEVLWGVPFSAVPNVVAPPTQDEINKIVDDFVKGGFRGF